MNNKGISVVIPNYNGSKLLPVIIPPLLIALKKSGLQFEIIVSDDNSTDDSLTFLKNNFPQIILFTSTVNKGFSHTINKGAFAARFSYILFLNSDVIISENYFNPLFRYFEKDDTFGVMGRIIGWNDDVIQDAAKYPSFHGAKIKTTGNYYLQDPSENDWLYSMYLSGANAFVSRSKFLELAGFDEIYSPFYVEDYDLSLRAWRVGWKCYYEHFAICRHQVSTSIKSKNKRNFIKQIYYRNKMFLHVIHFSGTKLFLWYLQLLPELTLQIILGRFYYFNSFTAFLKSKKRIKASKHNLKLVAKKTGVFLSVKEVADSIINSIAQKEIKRFK